MHRFCGIWLLGSILCLGASANGLRQPPEDCRNVTQATEVLDAIQMDPTLEKAFCFVGEPASCVSLGHAQRMAIPGVHSATGGSGMRYLGFQPCTNESICHKPGTASVLFFSTKAFQACNIAELFWSSFSFKCTICTDAAKTQSVLELCSN